MHREHFDDRKFVGDRMKIEVSISDGMENVQFSWKIEILDCTIFENVSKKLLNILKLIFTEK